MMQQLRERARKLKREVYALYLACRHPRTPWYAKAWVALVVGYALSPIDLIPDFIPVLGYLDDLVLVPAGIALALKLVPPEVMVECRERAITEFEGAAPVSRKAAVVVVFIWLIALGFTAWLIVRAML